MVTPVAVIGRIAAGANSRRVRHVCAVDSNPEEHYSHNNFDHRDKDDNHHNSDVYGNNIDGNDDHYVRDNNNND